MELLLVAGLAWSIGEVDVSCVAVAEQVNVTPTRRARVGGKEPGVEFLAVRRLKIDILERAAQFIPARLQFAVRLINLSIFKPA